VLVNNAASDERYRFEELVLEAWNQQIALNLSHHVFAIQAIAPSMRVAGHGSIINVGSISAHVGLEGLSAYATANAGIEGLTRSLAREMGRDAIRVNCVIPGWILTERQRRLWLTPQLEAEVLRSQCLDELLHPGDVARLVLWLAADDSRLCTGQNWIVDGGWM
jgi:NAD(P)-dependent dehydrogenase (short-subunit alcohol dehydrogenase family)